MGEITKRVQERRLKSYGHVMTSSEKISSLVIVYTNEVKVAMSRMKKGKETGMGGIPVDVWKCLGEEGIDMLCDLMQRIYE